MMDYVIIGNSAAGIGAVEGIRDHDREGRLTVISDEPYHTYSRPLISYYLAGKVSREKMEYRPVDFYQQNRVEARLGDKVIRIDEDKKTVTLAGGEDIEFDKLLIAAGGIPFIPPVKGSNKENIFTFIRLDDAKVVAGRIEMGLDSGRAVILGAGLIGLKAAEALVKRGLKVTVVELADRVLSTILDQEAASLVQANLENKGIEFILEDTIEEFTGDREARQARLKSGTVVDCDLAIMAVGVRPEVTLVEGTGIEINRGILVNKMMETNKKGIYAAGDVSEGYDMLRGSSGVIPIWPNAYNQGLTAGKNMAGAGISYEEGFARNSISFFGMPMITAGIINPEGDDYRVKVLEVDKDKVYKKIILKGSRLVGFIYLNAVDRAGILTGLIKEQEDISELEDKILADDFGYLSFGAETRREKLWKV